jgi:hypothetical protein
MLVRKIARTTCLLALSLTTASAIAAVSATEAARLGKDLTPFGAEKAGSGDGTIPEWTGGITTPPAGYKPGDHHPDPYAGDQVLFTITGANADQYKDKLSPGQLALLKTYDTYKMNVYPTRRSASAPQRIYDATVANATSAKLVADGNGVADAIIGVPFPIPQNGHEAIWNHILRYRGEGAARWIAQAAPTRSGKYTLVKFEDEFDFLYSKPGAKFEDLHNKII